MIRAKEKRQRGWVEENEALSWQGQCGRWSCIPFVLKVKVSGLGKRGTQVSILMIKRYPPAPCLCKVPSLCTSLLPLKDQASVEGCACSFTIDSSSESNKVSGTIESIPGCCPNDRDWEFGKDLLRFESTTNLPACLRPTLCLSHFKDLLWRVLGALGIQVFAKHCKEILDPVQRGIRFVWTS